MGLCHIFHMHKILGFEAQLKGRFSLAVLKVGKLRNAIIWGDTDMWIGKSNHIFLLCYLFVTCLIKVNRTSIEIWRLSIFWVMCFFLFIFIINTILFTKKIKERQNIQALFPHDWLFSELKLERCAIVSDAYLSLSTFLGC